MDSCSDSDDHSCACGCSADAVHGTGGNGGTGEKYDVWGSAGAEKEGADAI